MNNRFLVIILVTIFSTLTMAGSPILSSPSNLFAAELGDEDPATDENLAEDTLDGGGDLLDNEEPAESYFSNPAQAAHAANLAEQVASRNDLEIQSALAAVEAAESEVDKLQAEAPDDLASLEDAQKQLEEAQDTYAATLSNVVGVTTEDILEMRNSGQGWGTIAHELGVHPGLLGLGRAKGKQKHYAGVNSVPDEVAAAMTQSELNEATARDTKSGWSQGHGFGLQSGVKSSNSSAFASSKKSTYSKGKGGVKGNNNGNRGGSYSGAGGLGGQNASDDDAGNGGGGAYGQSKNDTKSSSNNKGPGGKSSNKGGKGSNGNKGGDKGNNGKGKK